MLLVENQQYDNSVAYGYLYQMVINISGVYYLYYSADPFFIYENSGNIYEAFNGVNTYRAINQSGVFINPQKMVSNSGSTELSQDYIAWNTARNLDQFVYSNFDILKWGTSELLVSGIWKEPKTNWIIDDKFNYTDYNRIKNNIELLHQMSLDLYRLVPNINLGKDKEGYADFPYADEFNNIEDFLQLIEQNTYNFSGFSPKTWYENQHVPNYEDFNRIENACLEIKRGLERQKSCKSSLSIRLGNKFNI